MNLARRFGGQAAARRFLARVGVGFAAALAIGNAAILFNVTITRPVETSNPSVDRERSMAYQAMQDTVWLRQSGTFAPDAPTWEVVADGTEIRSFLSNEEALRYSATIPGATVSYVAPKSWDGVVVTNPERPTQPAMVLLVGDTVLVDHTGGGVRFEPARRIATLANGTPVTVVCQGKSFVDFRFGQGDLADVAPPGTLSGSLCYFRTAAQLAQADRNNAVYFAREFAPWIGFSGVGAAAALAIGGASLDRFRSRLRRAVVTDIPTLMDNPRPHSWLGGLTTEVNHSLARAKVSVEQQHSFVADAAHELRSPLTTLITTLEVAERHPHLVDPVEVNRSSLTQARRLERLADDLLTLATLDARTPRRQDFVNIADVVRGVVAESSVRGTPIELTVSGPVVAVGDPEAFRRIVQNLVDNAVRHAASTVSVTVAVHDGDTVVTVANDGAAIADCDADRIFERFARLDDARSRDSGGTGLGLAIARELAQRYAGELDLERSRRHGASFSWRIPTAQ